MNYRAWDMSRNYNSVGVKGRIQLPTESDVAGFSSTNGRQSVGDIFMQNGSNGDFVQAGWYVGHGDQLPYAATPTIFIGEYHKGDQNDELLRTYSAMSFNVPEYFKIIAYSYNYHTYYNIYAGGNFIDSTVYSHDSIDQAGFVGEVDYNSVSMWALARNSSSPYATLKYKASGTWNFFDDLPLANSTQYTDYQVNKTATALSWGPGTCS